MVASNLSVSPMVWCFHPACSARATHCGSNSHSHCHLQEHLRVLLLGLRKTSQQLLWHTNRHHFEFAYHSRPISECETDFGSDESASEVGLKRGLACNSSVAITILQECRSRCEHRRTDWLHELVSQWALSLLPEAPVPSKHSTKQRSKAKSIGPP